MEPTTPKINLEFSRELKQVIQERNMLTTRTKKRVCDVLDAMEIENISTRINRKIENAIFEIIVSEKAYIRQLDVIKTFFMKPVLEQNLLHKRQFQELFDSIDIIYNVNKHLLQDLYENSNNVAQAFLNFAPYFKLYSSYAAGYKNAIVVLQKCKKTNPSFFKFLERQETRPEVQSKLSALLITPIQRLPRYSLLLQNLLQVKSPTHKDYTALQDALEKINEVVSEVNKFIKDCENQQRLLEVQRYFKNSFPNVVVPGRVLIKEGVLSEFKKNLLSSPKYYVVLLNDIILFAKCNERNIKTNTLKCSSIFPLKRCKVQPYIEKGCFEITCENEEINLFHRELSVTSDWIDAINNAIQDLCSNKRTLRKESSARRPVKRKNLNEYHEESLNIQLRPRKIQKIYKENSSEDSPDDTLITNDSSISEENKTEIKINMLDIRNKQIRGRKGLSQTKQYETFHSTPKSNDLPQKTLLKRIDLKTDNNSPVSPLENGSFEERTIRNKNTDLFVFGKDNPGMNTSFSFRIGNIVSGIKLSLKNMFTFRGSK